MRFTAEMYSGNTIEDLEVGIPVLPFQQLCQDNVLCGQPDQFMAMEAKQLRLPWSYQGYKLGFPGFNEPARKYIDDIIKEEEDDAKTKPYLSFN